MQKNILITSRIWKDFSDKTQKTHNGNRNIRACFSKTYIINRNRKINKFNHINIKNLYLSKVSMLTVNRQTENRAKIFPVDIPQRIRL